MNTERLHSIFQKYIDNFELLNDRDHDETYKWETAQAFSLLDLNAEDFVQELLKLKRISSNLIDNGQELPLEGLISFAKNDKEKVREMFRELFADDWNDLTLRQSKIDKFIKDAKDLKEIYYPDSYKFLVNQRSAMQFLFLRDPDNNYMYKASQAKSFADCIEFYDDWGPMSDFRIDVFYRMCDMLVKEINNYPALIETHKSRYENNDRNLHPDTNLHILVFDIIYTSQAYNFYDGMDITPIDAKARRLYEERVQKAKTCYENLEKAKREMENLDGTISLLKSKFTVGKSIKHKVFKTGEIVAIDDQLIAMIKFDNVEKKIDLKALLVGKLILTDDEELSERFDEIITILKRALYIPKNYKEAEKEFEKYSEYLI